MAGFFDSVIAGQELRRKRMYENEAYAQNKRDFEVKQQGILDAEEEKTRNKTAGMVRYVEQALNAPDDPTDPLSAQKKAMRVNAAWKQVKPYAEQVFGQSLPDEWNDSVRQGFEQVRASVGDLLAGSGAQSSVHSTKIGADGYYYTVGRDGKCNKSDVQAPPDSQVLEGQNGYYNINKRNNSASPVTMGGGQPPAPNPPLVQQYQPKLTVEQRLAKANEMIRSGQYTVDQVDAWMAQEAARRGYEQVPQRQQEQLRAPQKEKPIPDFQQKIEYLVKSVNHTPEQARQIVLGYGAGGARGANVGKPLINATVQHLTTQAETADNIEELKDLFNDSYAGNKIGGGLENLVGRLGLPGATKGQPEWWQKYDRMKNKVRNELFGASLTPSEQAAFEATDINANMGAPQIRENLTEQVRILRSAMSRQGDVWKSQGYNGDAIDAATKSRRTRTVAKNPRESLLDKY